MNFPIPSAWERDTAEFERDDHKRRYSPCSFFYSQGRALVLAAGYFSDDRLISTARGGVAQKHRHRVQLALFGQLMASYEYMLKDFLAQVIDAADVFDERLSKQKWIDVNVERVLSQRIAQTSIGALLVHPTLGWHYPEQVNERYRNLLGNEVIDGPEIPTLNRLWILRHSVAHNAGFVTAPDAGRMGSAQISEAVIDTDDDFITQVFEFLCPIAKRLAERCGNSALQQWLRSISSLEADYTRDRLIYERLKLLSTYVSSRPQNLPEFTEQEYLSDYARVNTSSGQAV